VLIAAGSIILLLFSVVVVHEFGHFVVGKLSGIRVDEFSVGFGPRIVARRIGETLYALRWLPLGGYVRMAGMLGLASEADACERNFYRASMPRRLATISAGVVFNFVFAILLFTIVNMVPTSSQIFGGSPAAAAGLHDGDTITSVDGRAIRSAPGDVSADLHAATAASQGYAMRVTYRTSSGQLRTVTVKPELVITNPVAKSALPLGSLVVTSINGAPVGTGDPAALLGAGKSVTVGGVMQTATGPSGKRIPAARISGVADADNAAPTVPGAAWRIGITPGADGEPFPAAVADGAKEIPTFVHDTAVGLYQLITVPRLGGVTGPQGLSGPVGIAKLTVTAAHGGFINLLQWIGLISMNLGLINILPIPFLDGGKLLFLGIEAFRRKRLDPRYEMAITAVGLVLVVLFVIYVTIGDVGRPT